MNTVVISPASTRGFPVFRLPRRRVAHYIRLTPARFSNIVAVSGTPRIIVTIPAERNFGFRPTKEQPILFRIRARGSHRGRRIRTYLTASRTERIVVAVMKRLHRSAFVLNRPRSIAGQFRLILLQLLGNAVVTNDKTDA